MRGLTDDLSRRVARRDTIVFGCIMDARSGAAVEMYHDTGFDALLVDREHTGLNSETVLEHIRLARALGLPCMVRVADSSYHELCRTLDQAPDGVFVPRIRTRADVEAVVRTVRYPPRGVRGLGASTCPAGRYLGWESPGAMVDGISANLVLGIQIETAEALADLDGILSVDGVDIAVVGNDDLSLGMGIVGQFDTARYLAAVESVIAACTRHGVLPGIACGDPERMRFWADRGMRVFWSASDITLMWAAGRDLMRSVRAALGRELTAVEERWSVVRLNAVTFPVTDDERSILARAGCGVSMLEGTTDAEIAAAVADADAVMVVAAYLGAPVIGAMRRCRLISRLGTGVDKIDLDEATRRGIPVTNLPDFCTGEVADHTLALLLAAARQLKFMETSMRAGRQPREIADLHRLSTRTLAMVGFGRIGRAVARRAASFGMTLLAVDPALAAEEAARAGVEKVDLGAALERADYLCLLCPLTPATRGMIGMSELRRMKRDAVLVNTARGEIVNEAELAAALRGGVIRYAALDVFAGINVFAPGGFAVDHPFFGLGNVLLTPHMAAGSEEALADARQRGARAVVEVLEGRAPSHPVNPGVVPWYT